VDELFAKANNFNGSGVRNSEVGATAPLATEIFFGSGSYIPNTCNYCCGGMYHQHVGSLKYVCSFGSGGDKC
jgi:hypothetical protein